MEAAARGWQPLELVRQDVTREASGPRNGFEITFVQGMIWGIIGCVMSFAVGLVSERTHGTFVRLQMAPVSAAQLLGGKALACLVTLLLMQTLLLTVGMLFFGLRHVAGAARGGDAERVDRLRRRDDAGGLARTNGRSGERRGLGHHDADGDARRRDDSADRHARLDDRRQPRQPDQMGRPRARRSDLARLRAGRHAAPLRHPPHPRRPLLRRGFARPSNASAS